MTTPMPLNTIAQGVITPATDGARDFDFLMGRWRVHNRRLRERLKGSTQWDEFAATSIARLLPGGLGNSDEYRTQYWKDFVGMSFRFFNPTTRQWAIYWADNLRGSLEPPVFGTFLNGNGTFEGMDVLDGRSIRVRFEWLNCHSASPVWQQSFSEDGVSWETNWVMEMTRLGD